MAGGPEASVKACRILFGLVSIARRVRIGSKRFARAPVPCGNLVPSPLRWSLQLRHIQTLLGASSTLSARDRDSEGRLGLGSATAVVNLDLSPRRTLRCGMQLRHIQTHLGASSLREVQLTDSSWSFNVQRAAWAAFRASFSATSSAGVHGLMQLRQIDSISGASFTSGTAGLDEAASFERLHAQGSRAIGTDVCVASDCFKVGRAMISLALRAATRPGQCCCATFSFGATLSTVVCGLYLSTVILWSGQLLSSQASAGVP